MGTGQRRSALTYVPGYKNNGVLQLILAVAVGYTILAIIWALIMIVYVGDASTFNVYFVPNIALGTLATFKDHWWTLLSYGFFEIPAPVSKSFFELVSNLLWLYCFGSVVQSLVGHKQVIPLYIYALLVGGAFYYIGQLLPGKLGDVPPHLLGSRAGLVGMAVAAVTLTPKYRFFLTDQFSIPLLLVAGVFIVLMVIGAGFYLPVMILMAGGGLMGFVYVRLLKAGYKPSEWIYTTLKKIESVATPSEKLSKPRGRVISMYQAGKGITQSTIDEILDKINQKGYNSLTKEEKEMLLRAGGEK